MAFKYSLSASTTLASAWVTLTPVFQAILICDKGRRSSGDEAEKALCATVIGACGTASIGPWAKGYLPKYFRTMDVALVASKPPARKSCMFAGSLIFLAYSRSSAASVVGGSLAVAISDSVVSAP